MTYLYNDGILNLRIDTDRCHAFNDFTPFEIDIHQFPNGEDFIGLIDRTIRYSDEATFKQVVVNAIIESNPNEAIMRLAFLGKLFSAYGAVRTLNVQTLPYQRQDRHISKTARDKTIEVHQPNLCDVVLKILSQNYDKLRIYDIHNQSSISSPNQYPPELMCKEDGYRNIENIQVMWMLFNEQLFSHANADFLVFPDAGAIKRLENLTPYYKELILAQDRKMLTCEKKRLDENHLTIEVKEHKYDVPANAKFVIIDDLCDGGGTFIAVADILRKTYVNPYIVLAVTHGLFTGGFSKLNEYIDEIYAFDTNQAMPGYKKVNTGK